MDLKHCNVLHLYIRIIRVRPAESNFKRLRRSPSTTIIIETLNNAIVNVCFEHRRRDDRMGDCPARATNVILKSEVSDDAVGPSHQRNRHVHKRAQS